jgi:hypothetical protein
MESWILIRIRIKSEKHDPDPDPHQSEKQDPDPHQSKKIDVLKGIWRIWENVSDRNRIRIRIDLKGTGTVGPESRSASDSE